MEFDKAKGWLIGDVNRGLACMFTMMNEARLFVGVQGVAIGERAYQAALQYAHDRVQGVPPNGEKGAAIVHHPDVGRILVEMKPRLMVPGLLQWRRPRLEILAITNERGF